MPGSRRNGFFANIGGLMSIVKNREDVEKLDLSAYECMQSVPLPDLASWGLLLRHRKSGARIAVLSNTDRNKVFSIGFKTPPYNDTGLQHILEHSTLCGSRKYPVKDPFVELVKGSLNTFLNAMTYPDKTVYPVASCNDADFKNIMDVYLDAVFYPNIYIHPEIFRQEGWHYEMANRDDTLKVNGVVFNEMKGVYSSADDVLERKIMMNLYPDTCYAFESGGDPKVIPTLKYEDFLAYHKAYYDPSNSYIYLYGDFDVQERLDYLDREYLSAFDGGKMSAHPEIAMQTAFDAPRHVRSTYAAAAGTPKAGGTYLSKSWSVGTTLDPKLLVAMDAIDYVLVQAPGAVLKKRLLEEGIGTDIDSSWDTTIQQPVYSIVARGADESGQEKFDAVIADVMREISEKGPDEKMLAAGLQSQEFRYREADYGRFPKGLMYYLSMMDSWLYDETKPFVRIELGDVYRELESGGESEYFAGVVKKWLVDNPSCVDVTLVPDETEAHRREAEEQKRLAEIKAGMTPEQLDGIVESAKELKAYQSEPSPQEDLKKVPMLKLSDISPDPVLPVRIEKQIAGRKVIHTDIPTNGIGYVTLGFSMKNVPDSLLPYVGILSDLQGLMDTENYTYTELSNEIDTNLGGLTTEPVVCRNALSDGSSELLYEVRGKALYGKLDFLLSMMEEEMLRTKFTDTKRLSDILQQTVTRLETGMTSSGHTYAAMIASAQYSENAYHSDQFSGYRFYQTVKKYADHFDEKKNELIDAVKRLVDLIFTKENLIVSLGADETGYRMFEKPCEALISRLPEGNKDREERHFAPVTERVAYTTSSQVNYVARSGDFLASGNSYTGALQVLRIIFSYEYLWQNIRVRGGAYGCMSSFRKSGEGVLVSYRDPHIRQTDDVYRKAAEYVENFTVSDRDMLKYIIGTIGTVDTPMPASTMTSFSFSSYMSRVSDDELRRTRREIMTADQDSIRALAPIVRDIVDAGHLVVIGNQDQISRHKDMFTRICPFLTEDSEH